MPGKPSKREPEGRRHDAVGGVLGEAFERGARDARLIERLRIAADDAADRAPALSSEHVEPVRHSAVT